MTGTHLLELFIFNDTPQSIQAEERVRRVLNGAANIAWNLKVIDIAKHPEVLEERNIIAVPVLIKHVPEPEYRVVGDMEDADAILRGLGVH